MPRGDELMQMRSLVLYFLYESGAIGHKSAVDYRDIEVSTGISHEDLKEMGRSLMEEGLVKGFGGAWIAGGKSGYSAVYWLTADGLKEASSVAAGVREQLERQRKGKMGLWSRATAATEGG
jgi:hypothetical protein